MAAGKYIECLKENGGEGPLTMSCLNFIDTSLFQKKMSTCTVISKNEYTVHVLKSHRIILAAPSVVMLPETVL